ncbi:MAG TPA: hypothetical protein VKT31_10025 [Solirubrobacteraceae bacterium]|nr:hypothetical protein [Solirubrobacteraceae bacterium]
MTLRKNVLVVANVTAASDELCHDLSERAEREPAAFTLVVPATHASGGRAAAQETLTRALERLHEAGIEADGTVGHSDPMVAVSDVWDPRRYDEIIISTLPMGSSRWLHAGLPERIFKLTGAKVSHIISTPPKPPVPTVPAPHHEHAALGPLSVLGWGGPHAEARARP